MCNYLLHFGATPFAVCESIARTDSPEACRAQRKVATAEPFQLQLDPGPGLTFREKEAWSIVEVTEHRWSLGHFNGWPWLARLDYQNMLSFMMMV